jgi:glycosyltransferase involved in cell wall biosynthesis
MRGGIEKSMLDVCRGLHDRGHTISLLYEQAGDQIAQYQEFCHFIYQVDSFRLSKQNLFSSIQKLLEAIWQVPKFEETVIYTSQYYTFFFGYILALLKNAPFVCHLRLPAPVRLDGNWSRSLTLLKERATLSGVTRFIAISNFIKNEWAKTLRLNLDKFDVIYNGINTDSFKPANDISALRKQWNIAPAKKIIVYVGRLDQHKGVETLIKALAILKRQRSDLQLIIAGKSILETEDYERSLCQLVSELDLEADVWFPGYAKTPASLYQLSDVMVLPSIWAEPFGRTIIESFACGTPVVASRTGGIPEAFSSELQEFLFEPNNEDDLAAVLNKILDWREKIPELGAICRQHAIANFQIERTVAGVEQSLIKAMHSTHSKRQVFSKQGIVP